MSTKSSVLNRVRMFEVGSTKSETSNATLSPKPFHRRQCVSPSGSSFVGTDSPSRKSDIQSPRVRSPSVLARYKYPTGDPNQTLSPRTSPGRLPSKRLEPFDSPKSRVSPLPESESKSRKSFKNNPEVATTAVKPSDKMVSAPARSNHAQKRIHAEEMREDTEVMHIVSWSSPEDGTQQAQKPCLSAHDDENRDQPPLKTESTTPTARQKARTNLAMRRRGTPSNHLQSSSVASEEVPTAPTFNSGGEKALDEKVGHIRSRNLSAAQHIAKRKPLVLKEDHKKLQAQSTFSSSSPVAKIRLEGLKRNLEDASVVMKEERVSSVGSSSSVRSSLSHDELKNVAKRALEISNVPSADAKARTSSSLRQKIQYQQRVHKKTMSSQKSNSTPGSKTISTTTPSQMRSKPSNSAEISSETKVVVSRSQEEQHTSSRVSKMSNAMHRKRCFSPASPLRSDPEYVLAASSLDTQQSRQVQAKAASNAISSPCVDVKSKDEEKAAHHMPADGTKSNARIAVLAAARRSKNQLSPRQIANSKSNEESDFTMNSEIHLPFLTGPGSAKRSFLPNGLELKKDPSTESTDITSGSSPISRNSSRGSRAKSLRVQKFPEQSPKVASLPDNSINVSTQQCEVSQGTQSSKKLSSVKGKPNISRAAALQKLSADPTMKRFPRTRIENGSSEGSKGNVASASAIKGSDGRKQDQSGSPRPSPLRSSESVSGIQPVSSAGNHQSQEPRLVTLSPVFDEVRSKKMDSKVETDDILASFLSFKAATPEPRSYASNTPVLLSEAKNRNSPTKESILHSSNNGSASRKSRSDIRTSRSVPRKENLKRPATTKRIEMADRPTSLASDKRHELKQPVEKSGSLTQNSHGVLDGHGRADSETKTLPKTTINPRATRSDYDSPLAKAPTTENIDENEINFPSIDSKICMDDINDKYEHFAQMDACFLKPFRVSALTKLEEKNVASVSSARKRTVQSINPNNSPISVRRRPEEASSLRLKQKSMGNGEPKKLSSYDGWPQNMDMDEELEYSSPKIGPQSKENPAALDGSKSDAFQLMETNVCAAASIDSIEFDEDFSIRNFSTGDSVKVEQLEEPAELEGPLTTTGNESKSNTNDGNSEILDCQTYISSDTSEAFLRNHVSANLGNTDSPERHSITSSGQSQQQTRNSAIVASDTTSAAITIHAEVSIGGGSPALGSKHSDYIPSQEKFGFHDDAIDCFNLSKEEGIRQGSTDSIDEFDVGKTELFPRKPSLESLAPSLLDTCSSNYFQQTRSMQVSHVQQDDDGFFGADDFPFDWAPPLAERTAGISAEPQSEGLTTGTSSHKSSFQVSTESRPEEHQNTNNSDPHHAQMETVTPTFLPVERPGTLLVSPHQSKILLPNQKDDNDAMPFRSMIGALAKPNVANFIVLNSMDDEDIFSGLEGENNSPSDSTFSEINEFSSRHDDLEEPIAEEEFPEEDDILNEPPPPPPPHSGPPDTILEPSNVVNTVNSDITSSLLAGDVAKDQQEWVPPEEHHTIMEDPYEDGDETPKAIDSRMDWKSSRNPDNESVPLSDPTSFHSGSTKQTGTCKAKPTNDNPFKDSSIPAASILFRMGWDFFDSFTTNLCRVPGSSSTGDDDFQPAATLNQRERSKANTISGAPSDASTVTTMHTSHGSFATASQLSLNVQERRVWDEWDRRDSVNALNKAALLASTSNNSDECHDKTTEREKARDKLLTYASTAHAAVVSQQVLEEQKIIKHARTIEASTTSDSRSQMTESSERNASKTSSNVDMGTNPRTPFYVTETGSTFDLKTKSMEPSKASPASWNDVSERRTNLSSGDQETSTFEADDVMNCSEGVSVEEPTQSYAPTTSVPPIRKSRAARTQAALALSLRERRILEKFSSRLSNSGLEVLKQNRDRKWQTRFVTVSKEVTWLSPDESSHHSGDRLPCPKGILWLKKFTGKSKDVSLMNIDKQGRGGLAISQLMRACVSDIKAFKISLTRKQQVLYNGAAVVTLEYTCGGSTRSVFLLCKSADDAEFLVTGMKTISSFLNKRVSKDGSLQSSSLSANSTESHSLSVATSEEYS